MLRDVRDLAKILHDLYKQPLPPGYAVFRDELRSGRLWKTVFEPSTNNRGTTTEEMTMPAAAMAKLPGASTSAVTTGVQLGHNENAASIMKSTRQIMDSTFRLPPRGAYAYWDTIMWELETRTTTAPDYGTMREEFVWTVVHREVHMSPGYHIGSYYLDGRIHPDATIWRQTVYSEAGKYDEEKKAALDRAIHWWLERKMRTNFQCGKKQQRKWQRVVKMKKTVVKFVKQARGIRERTEATVTNMDGGDGEETKAHADLSAPHHQRLPLVEFCVVYSTVCTLCIWMLMIAFEAL